MTTSPPSDAATARTAERAKASADLLKRLTVPKTDRATRMSILIKGPPGTGKTHFTLEAPGPILNIYTDANRATLEAAQTTRPDITEIYIENYKTDLKPLMTPLNSRLLDYETIIVDSYDMLHRVIHLDVQGTASQMTQQGWGELLNESRSTTHQLTQLCRPQRGKRDYNFVATVKIQDKSDDGNLVSYEPSLTGSFRSSLESYFDIVLLADSETVRDKDPITQKSVQRKVCFLWTVPPSRYHTTKAPLHWPARIYGGWAELQGLIDKDLKGNSK